MSEIIWEDPPETRGAWRKRDWASIVAELRGHPGKWALVESGKRSTMSNIGTALRARDCEVKVRTVDGVTRVYARWPEATSS